MKPNRFLVLFPLALAASLLLAFGHFLSSSAAAPVPQSPHAPDDATIYVDHTATGAATGLSWTDAFTNVQDALSATVSGDQIWIAEGTYTPTLRTDPGDPRTATFNLVEGVALYGGFDGTETSLDQRDWETHITVLSGDLDNNDLTDPYGVVTDTANIVGDNAYHVTNGGGVTETVNTASTDTHYIATRRNVTEAAIVDGFTITAGKADGDYSYGWGGGMSNTGNSPTLTNVVFSGNLADRSGGGMFNWNSSPTLTNVIFFGNSAYYGGGGMRNYQSSSPTLMNVTFSGNSAGFGGGMSDSHQSSPMLTNVTFSSNLADNYGGGMDSYYQCSPVLINVTFSSNSAGIRGGGMVNVQNSPTLTNVTFFDNSAGDIGGGMSNRRSSSPTLMNVTFSGNSADFGGGMANDSSNPLLTDVTFSGNSAGHRGGGMFNDASNPTLTDVTFSSNSAKYGGGMHNYDNSSPTLINTTFAGNSVDTSGGGMFNEDYCSPVLTNVTFFDNLADFGGGGVFNENYGTPVLTNVIFSGNSAGFYGGGMRNYQSSPTLINVAFSGNSAGDAGGGMHNYEVNPTLTNTILWGNTAVTGTQIHNDDSIPTIAYSDIQDSGGSGAGWDASLGIDGGGNIDANPLFAAPTSGNLRLQLTSPGIDAGDNTAVPITITVDLDENPRFVDIPAVPDTGNGTPPIVDMGAYEYQPLTLLKTVNSSTPEPGQRITYTIQATNWLTTTITGATISDTLPAGVTLAGPITLDPPGAGLVQGSPPLLVHNLTITGGQRITITFPVTVNMGLAAGTAITNTAVLTAPGIITPITNQVRILIANVPPIAANDAYTTTEGIPLVIAAPGLLANDSDADGDSLTAILDTGPATGTLALAADGSLVYTPTLGYTGALTFTYTASDGMALSAPATVTITVAAAPVTEFKIYLPTIVR